MPGHVALGTNFFIAFYLLCSADHRDLHSFPTRRSSDLGININSRICPITKSVAKSDISTILQIYSRKGCVNVNPNPNPDRKSTRLNSSHSQISYAVFCLKKKNKKTARTSGAGIGIAYLL